MNESLLLWVYVVSAAWLAFVYLSRRESVGPRILIVALAVGVVAGAGLVWPEHESPAFVVSTVGFVLFLALPGVLVRIARRFAAAGRFRAAAGVLTATLPLAPAVFLKRERDVYRQIAAEGGALHPFAADVRARLNAAIRPAAPCPVTATFTAVIVLVHLVVTVAGSTTSMLTLLRFGANCYPLVEGGEWFRVLTAVFLHSGLIHLLFNVLAIWVVGRWAEPTLGSARLAIVFLLGGALGNLVSLYHHAPDPVISVGSSGAAMALIGAALAVYMRAPPSAERSSRIRSLLAVIAATAFLGLVEPRIDNGAHLGGLAAGFVLAAILLPIRARRAMAALAILLALAYAGAFVWMAVRLPRWSEDRVLETRGFSVTYPGFLEPSRNDREWSFAWHDIAGVELEMTRGRHVEIALSRLMTHEAGGGWRAEDPAAVAAPPGWWARRMIWSNSEGGHRRDVFARRSGDDDRSVILVFHTPPDDEELRERLIRPFVTGFRFR